VPPVTPLWISHHRPEHYGRCVRLAGLHVCARCLGVYPMLFAALALQIAFRAALRGPWDPWMALALPVPALVDWALGRFRPASGTNARRLLTGALLGASLARTLYLHLRWPGHPLAMAQFLALLAAAVVVEGARLWRRRRPDPSLGSPVDPSER
jgi:uncharacterized membrane protein